MFLIGSFLGRILLIAGMGAATFVILAYCAHPIERWFKHRAEKANTLHDRISKL
jgi:hypothetical protein